MKVQTERSLGIGILAPAGVVAFVLTYPLLRRIPSLVIIGGDQAHYAAAAIDLYQSWQHGFGAGLSGMLASIGFKPPILPWTGQLLLPFRTLFGSSDAVLLYGIGLLMAVALVLLCVSVLKLCGNEILPAVYGASIAATAPLLQYLFNEYLVEPTQFFVVCWFLLVLCYSRSWDRSMVLAQLIWAGSVALLSKSTSAAYVVAPGLVASYFLFSGGDSARRWNFHRLPNLIALASGLVAALATLSWYGKNYPAVRAARRDPARYGSFRSQEAQVCLSKRAERPDKWILTPPPPVNTYAIV